MKIFFTGSLLFPGVALFFTGSLLFPGVALLNWFTKRSKFEEDFNDNELL